VSVIVWVGVALVAMVAVGAGVVWLVNHPIEEVTIETQKSATPAVTMTMPMPRPPEPPAEPGPATTAPAAPPPASPAQPTAPGVSELQRLFNEANAGNRQAQFLAGLTLAEGKLLPANLPEAFKWFAVAAERGHPDAQNNLAIFYIRGMGVPKDLVIAYKWIALARAGGNRDAAANEERLRQMLQPEELARAQQQVASFIPKP
jgi:TPR repeat protein